MERQQRERTGVDKADHLAEIGECWASTKDGPGFVKALEAKGYVLARGERHGKSGYCLIDLYGEVRSISRYIEAPAKEIRARLSSSHPLDGLPSVDEARAAAKQKLEQLRARIEDAYKDQKASPLDDRREALAERQQRRRAELEKQRLDLHTRQFRERSVLRDMQASDNDGVAAERLRKQPKGLMAFLTRVTGVSRIVSWAQGQADKRREAEHQSQREALARRHGRELKEMDRHFAALDRLDRRENSSARYADLREGYRRLRLRVFALTPEFEKATKAQQPLQGGGGDSRGIVAAFNRLAEGVGFTQGDLQAAFERAKAGKVVPQGDADTQGRAPVDPDKLAAAERLRDEIRARAPKREDPDRER